MNRWPAYNLYPLGAMLIFLALFGFSTKRDKFDIGLLVDKNIPKEEVRLVVKGLEGYYRSKIHVIKEISLPDEFNADTINVLKLMDHLEKNVALPHQKNIFFTAKGIRGGGNGKYSLRGFSRLNGKVGIVSTLVALHETTTKKQYEDLLAQILIHEMGHLFGLKHCSDNDRCVMVSSLPKPDKFYNAENKWCTSCLEKADKHAVRKKYHQPNF